MDFYEKSKWELRTGRFTVSVERHMQVGSSEGPWRWFVYAYIYPAHPLHAKMQTRDDAMEEAASMPLHGGCTYAAMHKSWDNEVKSIQVGCDYHHLYDEEYTYDADGASVKADARRLFKYLSEL